MMNAGACPGKIPLNVFEKLLAMVTAGLAKLVDAVKSGSLGYFRRPMEKLPGCSVESWMSSGSWEALLVAVQTGGLCTPRGPPTLKKGVKMTMQSKQGPLPLK